MFVLATVLYGTSPAGMFSKVILLTFGLSIMIECLVVWRRATISLLPILRLLGLSQAGKQFSDNVSLAKDVKPLP